MKVIDLTKTYREHFLDHDDSSTYFASYPKLFTHYHTYWGKEDGQPVRLQRSELATRRKNILEGLPEVEKQFSALGLDLSEIELILMVGHNTSNGHAFVLDGRTVCWLAVETYTTRLLARVFVTHELLHALHYLQNVSFRFLTKDQMLDPMRQLLTEGIATRLTRDILNVDSATSLWADHLQPEESRAWLQQCREHLSAIKEHFLTARQDGTRTELFLANDPNDILKFRSGYYLGLWVVEQLVSRESLSPSQLLSYPREKLVVNVLELLRE